MNCARCQKPTRTSLDLVYQIKEKPISYSLPFCDDPGCLASALRRVVIMYDRTSALDKFPDDCNPFALSPIGFGVE